MKIRVNFILQQGCTGSGASGANISCVHQDCLHPFLRQMIRDQGPRDPPADDGDFAGFIVFKRGIVGKQAVFQAPERMSRL
jgi:hypothetical protein